MKRRHALLTALVSMATTIYAAPPARIVSTSPSVTETLFALGLGPQVVGVSSFCRYPADVATLTRVGSYLRPDVEVIARLGPDLVVINAGPHQAEGQLAKLGIRAIAVAPDSFASVFATITAIGDAASVPDRASALVSALRQRLDRVRASVAGRPARKVLVIVGRRTGTLSDLVAVSGSSYLGELIGIAGGVNVLTGDRLPAYPRISMETVIRLAPDVIVDAADMGETPESRRLKEPATQAMWRRQRSVAAVTTGHLHVVTSDAFFVPGPRLVEVAETFAQWIHGVSAR